MSTLRPPLPPPLSHEGIVFITGTQPARENQALAPDTVAAIGAALLALLPPGDITAIGDGRAAGTHQRIRSSWECNSLQEGIGRRLV